MTIKPIKLSAKKDGRGYISSYTFNIGVKEAKACNFVSEDGEVKALNKIIDYENNQIIIKLSDA